MAMCMRRGVTQRVVHCVDKALGELGVDVAQRQEDVEAIAVLVHRMMSCSGRVYHSTEHVFTLFDEAETPLVVLAALFHDIVYYQIHGLPKYVQPFLQKSVRESNGEVWVLPTDDELLLMVRGVFDFKADTKLGIFAGLNEFCSAVVAAESLRGLLSREQICLVTMCIEATIPFRKPDTEGREWYDHLAERCVGLISEYNLALTARDVHQWVGESVEFANRDVQGFAAKAPEVFLQSTWKLLPEANGVFRSGLFTAKDYNKALLSQRTFFMSLNPSQVFSQYQGRPSSEEHARMLANCEDTLAVSSLYLSFKLMAGGIVTACADLSGGDTIISLFLGEKSAAEGPRLDLFLPSPPSPEERGLGDSELYDRAGRILFYGRGKTVGFDLEKSPTAYFIHATAPRGEVEHLQQATAAYLVEGTITGMEYLRGFPSGISREICRCMSRLVSTRRQKLLDLAASLEPS